MQNEQNLHCEPHMKEEEEETSKQVTENNLPIGAGQEGSLSIKNLQQKNILNVLHYKIVLL